MRETPPFIKIVICLFSAVLIFFSPALTLPIIHAHDIDYMAINTSLDVFENKFLLHTEIAEFISSSVSGVEENIKNAESYFQESFTILQNGKPCPVTITDFQQTKDPPKTSFKGEFICQDKITDVKDIEIISTVFTDLYGSFDHFIKLKINNTITDIVFTPQNLSYPSSETLPNKPTSSQQDITTQIPSSFLQTLPSISWRFIKLGIEHILTGYDHILFLLMIILPLVSFSSVFLLISSFTIAHSITIILAGLGLITLTSKVVEPIIALSILIMAIRNIFILRHKSKKINVKERLVMTFGFGLIHGLGFAGALQNIKVPKDFFIPAVLAFNIGIEIGQIMILSYVVPYLKLMLLKKWAWRKKVLYVIVFLVILVSFALFIQRILGVVKTS